MRGRRGLILLAVLTFVVGLLSLFPARVAYRWFAPPEVLLGGIDGTVWNGSARQASVSGLYLQDLRWRVKPLQLIIGRVAAVVEARPASGFIEGDVSIGIGGSLKVRDMNASLPLNAVATLVNMQGLQGSASARFERIVVEDGLPVAADGEFTVADLVAPRVYRGSIGGYRAEFFTQNNGVVASVEDTDGSIDVAGSLQVSSDRSYQFIAKLAPKPGMPESIERQLRILGSPDDRGQRELRLEGQL